MTTDHEMRMEALRLFEENERLLDLLRQVDHTLVVHGHVDRGTPQSAPPILASHSSGERLPSGDAAEAGGEAALSTDRT